MKVDELIEELNKFKEEHGNLEVGIARINSAYEDYEDVAYYSDIAIFKVKDSYLYTSQDSETIDYWADVFCALG